MIWMEGSVVVPKYETSFLTVHRVEGVHNKTEPDGMGMQVLPGKICVAFW